MQIFCEHPVIIRNPKLGLLLCTHRSYTHNGQITTIPASTARYWSYRFPEHQFSPRKFNVTLDNIDDFAILNLKTGEQFPMFIQVPCGKCELCRKKKSTEWAFRATCENVYSTSQPLFITLTYNNNNLPKHGVFKEEIQLFLKRLRIRLDRKGFKHELRYFAVSEYGSKSGRPHYHLIVWNFPRTGELSNLWNVTHLVENAWSHIIGYDNQKPIYEQLGFVYTLPCEKGAIGYVMKYMRKKPNVPKDMNGIFFLSSRKGGGIGSKYAKSLIDFYRKNPQCLDITVCDPYTGQSTTVALPAYFKRLYFPADSSVVSKEVRDAFKKLQDCFVRRTAIHVANNYEGKPKLTDIERKVLKKFNFLHPRLCSEIHGKMLDYYTNIPWQALDDAYVANECEIASLCRMLMLESVDVTWFKMKEEIIQKRTRALDERYGFLPPMNIDDLKYNIINANKLAELKEIL